MALFDPRWASFESDQRVSYFQSNTPNFSYGQAVRPSDENWWYKRLAVSRELLSVASYLNRTDQSKFYLERWESYLPDRAQKVTSKGIFRYLLKSSVGQLMLRAFELLVPPSREITQWISDFKPDVVVASPANMRYGVEIEYVKASNALGVPTVIQVYSWDNLTNKGLIHQKPNALLAWNREHMREAITIHKIDPSTISITGAPSFDKWFDSPEEIVAREDFCLRVGLNPEFPFVLYLGSSENISGDETWLIKALVTAVRSDSDSRLKNTGILVRPHPANAAYMSKLIGIDGLVVWPKEGSSSTREVEQQDFYNSLQHCAAAIGVNTTGMIDAVINNRPCVTILTDEYSATQSQASHFRHLLEADVLEVTSGPEDAVKMLGQIYSGEDPKEALRREFVSEFIRPNGLDKTAASLASNVIENTALGISVTDINTSLSV